MKIRTTTLPLLAIALAACAGDEPQTAGGASSDVRLSVSVGSLARSNPVGTPEQQRTFNAGDTIAVSDGTTKTKYVYNGTDWVGHNGVYLKWSGQATTFTARHGYSQEAEDYDYPFDKWWVQSDQSTFRKLSDADFMYGEARYDAAPEDGRIHLVMKRKTARIFIRIAGFKDQFEGKAPKVGDMNVYTNIFIPAGAAQTAVVPYMQGDGGTGTTFTALISPGSSNVYAQFSVNCDGETYKYDFLHKIATEEGKSYNFDLVVGNKAVATDVTVNDWTDGGVLDDAHIDEYPGYDIDDAGTYHIYYPNGLYNIAREINSNINIGRKIVLEDNIDIGKYANWTPIGTGGVKFEGNFDGKGHTISGMNIDVETAPEHLGLFGYVTGMVSNVHVSGKISVNKADNASIGGIIGYFEGDRATISGCHSDIDFEINGSNVTNSAIGGILGSNNQTSWFKMAACYFTGTMNDFSQDDSDENSVGGVCGLLRTNMGATFIACYTRAAVKHPQFNAIRGKGMAPFCMSCYYEVVDGCTPADANTANLVTDGWSDAMGAMNSTLSNNGYGYQYIPGLSAKIPLIAIKN